MSVHHTIEEKLKAFEPISLKEMDSVELMNRIDSKFIFNINQLPEMLEESGHYFKVLEINGERIFNYVTTYYDTPEFSLFNNHLSGKLNRHKIRHRTYESTGVSYLEVKFKTNKNRTIKWRIKNEMNGNFNKKATEFLFDHAKMKADSLNAVVTNSFKRITLVNINDKTRVTLDFDIQFKLSDSQQKALPYLAIAEIKQEGKNNNAFFIQLLKKKGIRESGFSKYCVGNALLYNHPANTLKPKLLQLKRIEKQNETHTFSH